MIFIYGRKAHQLMGEQIPDACPNCGNRNTMNMFVFQRYLHLFWIPVFPIEKTGVSICSHCKQTLKLNEMTPALRATYNDIKQKTKTPVWTFALLIVIGISISAGLISDVVHHKSKTTTGVTGSDSPPDAVPGNVSITSPAETKPLYSHEDAQKSMDEFAILLAEHKAAIKADSGPKNADVYARYDKWHETAMKLMNNLKGNEQAKYIGFYQQSLRDWTDATTGQ